MASFEEMFAPGKRPAKPRKPKMGEKGNSHTQVGELAASMPRPVEPTEFQKAKSMAKGEKLNATRRWIAGEISTAHHDRTHRRANQVMKDGKRFKMK